MSELIKPKSVHLSKSEPERAYVSVRRVAYFAVLTAIAVILSIIESMLPLPAPAPGVKLGLANMVTLILLLDEPNPICAIGVTVLRCLLSSLLSGVFSTLLFSMAGGLISCILMWFLLHFNYTFSPIGISVAGAIAHNAVQLGIASLIARTPAVFGYLPILLISGIVAGVATGIITVRTRKIFTILNR